MFDEPPRPIITEILYSVPTEGGDASGDGRRDAIGDEFVEIVNPGAAAINLRGYVLHDSAPDEKRRFRFEFPDVELAPGRCAVVFNSIDGAPTEAPTLESEGILVFVAAPGGALANAADWVVLRAPDGSPVQCVTWGRKHPSAPPPASRLDETATVRGRSITLDPGTGAFTAHAPDAFGPGVRP